ncbi:hypothetical protein BJV78DRAFT_384916 [Lactifluus subvellereus]|nr:hypothetical protein BJV78DRAFT_384916 [Lactifluus subvellereus]
MGLAPSVFIGQPTGSLLSSLQQPSCWRCDQGLGATAAMPLRGILLSASPRTNTHEPLITPVDRACIHLRFHTMSKLDPFGDHKKMWASPVGDYCRTGPWHPCACHTTRESVACSESCAVRDSSCLPPVTTLRAPFPMGDSRLSLDNIISA